MKDESADTADERPSGPVDKGPLERALAIFADVRRGEAPTALLLTLNVFLLLTAYYLLKVVREPLILASGGAEVKSYASAGQAVLLIGAVKIYSKLAQHVDRMRLTACVFLFFAANLVIFWVLAKLHVPLGVAFFLWVGIFSVTVIAQTWSFAADVYTEKQGKRLFAIVGIGSSLGAVLGAKIAGWLFKPLGPYMLMLIAAAILVGCLGIILVVHRRELARAAEVKAHKEAEQRKSEAPMGKEGGFTLLLRDKYLLLVAALTLVLNWVNTSGEYILDRTLLAVAAERGLVHEAAEQFIGTFKASYFGWVNIIGMALQLFVVSRIFKYLGIRVALFILPVIALGGYSTMLVYPVMGAIMVAKIAENSVDYSVQNTARQALFLVTTHEEKYKAKNVIDTFIVRFGDVLSAGVVLLGTTLGFATHHFILVNVVLAACWIVVVVFLARQHKKRASEGGHADSHAGDPPAGSKKSPAGTPALRPSASAAGA
jgi:ATP:ADP antiporter, AAA family